MIGGGGRRGHVEGDADGGEAVEGVGDRVELVEGLGVEGGVGVAGLSGVGECVGGLVGEVLDACEGAGEVVEGRERGGGGGHDGEKYTRI